MKIKINKILSFTSIVMLSLAGCTNTKHNHDGIHHNDETGHWNGCVVENCDERFNEEMHIWEDYVVVKEATCTSMGIEEHKCSVCGRKEQRNISRKNHTFPAEYEKDDNYHWSVCTTCNITKESSKVDHMYLNWNVLEEATTSKEGLKEGRCVCGHTIKEIIPKIVIPTKSIVIDEPKEIKNGGVSLSIGSFDLTYSILPNDASDYTMDDVVVSSSNEEVAVIKEGKVELLKEGYTEISVTNGVELDVLPLVVTSKDIDGNIETEYASYSYNSVVTNVAGYNTTTKTKVVFSEGGFYIIHEVDDKYISGMSHIESSMCFGDECKKENTLFMNFYPLEENYNHARFFINITDYSKYNELTGKKTLPCAVEGKVLGEKGNYEGYVIEAFMPYDVLKKYGFVDGLTSIKYLPLLHQYQNQSDADLASLLGSDDGINTYVTYGNINTLRAKYENHLLTTFNKDGSSYTIERAPIVKYTFDNGVITNEGTSTVNGRVTTINSDNSAIEELTNPTVTYGNDANGKENSAIKLSNKRAGGNHFTIGGVNVGTNDFTLSVKVNLLQLTEKTDRSNYLFGIGNKKDPDLGYFNVSYMQNKSMKLNQLAVGTHNTSGKITTWCGYIPVNEFAEIRLVRKENKVTVYLKYDANTRGIRTSHIELLSTDAINFTSACNLGFSSNIGSQNPGDYPAYFDDIYIYDYALPI